MGYPTVLDLLKRSMRMLGAADIGEQPTADEAQDLLHALMGLTDSWACEALMSYAQSRNIYSLVAGQQVYAIGPGPQVDGVPPPDWVAPRPTKIDGMGLIVPNTDPTGVLERPMHPLTKSEYQRIRIKGITSDLPYAFYYDRWFSNSEGAETTDVGSANVFIYPSPLDSYQVALYAPLLIAQLTTLTQIVGLPPGYARAIASNLAIEMAPEFDREPSQALVAIAEESKANVKRGNVRLNTLRVDRAMRSTHTGRFDWMIGEER